MSKLRIVGAGLVKFTCGCMLTALPAVTSAQSGGGEAPAVALGRGSIIQGTVTATAADRLTVKTEKGETYTIAVTPNTQVRKGRDPEKLADVHTGDGVGAVGEFDAPNKTVHAMMLFVVDAEQMKKARENMGKTYIAGKVTAIDEVKLTILRADGVSQTIQVDEDTSFRKGGRGLQAFGGGGGNFGGAGAGGSTAGAGGRQGANAAAGGESITLADVKVGDSVGGPGTLKNGIFVPTQLQVADPAAAGQGGRRRGGATPSTPGTTPPAGGPK